MNQPAIEPIRDSDLPGFCRFLTRNLSNARSAEAWADAFRQDWIADKPNNGFMLQADGEIVGGIGAIYAQYMVRGNPERFCNITSWCVLDQYRSQSMRLALALVSQPGFHYTDLTPTEVVAGTLQFLKFRPMNERQAVWPNLPWPFAFMKGVHAITAPEEIGKALSGDDARVYEDHRHFPWLNHLAIGRPDDYCYVAYKKCRLRGVPGAFVLGFSSPEKFLRYRLAAGNHLLAGKGLLFTRVESRLLDRSPWPSLELAGFRNKVFRSDTLGEADMSNFYTEIVALDL